ncbi:MAG: GFA family protein [Xanthomonadales bacterium]|nr:GFA family protein [Xanthomonadales bacterium]
MSKFAKGSCLCKKVRFEVKLPSKWIAHCHCSMCRKFHGAGYVTWVGIENKDLRFTKGADLITWYHSSKEAQRGSCSMCGSNFLFQSEQWPDEMHITLANFDTELDKKLQADAYFSTHVDWMPIDDQIKKIWK